MSDQELIIRIKSATDMEAGLGASFLADRIGPDATVRRVPEPGALDFGATLSIILGSAVLIEIAKGIADLIRRDRESSVTIEFPDGTTTTVSNVSQSTVESILASLEDKLG